MNYSCMHSRSQHQAIMTRFIRTVVYIVLVTYALAERRALNQFSWRNRNSFTVFIIAE